MDTTLGFEKDKSDGDFGFTFQCIPKQKEMASLWKIACLKCGSEQSRGRKVHNIDCTVYNIRYSVHS